MCGRLTQGPSNPWIHSWVQGLGFKGQPPPSPNSLSFALSPSLFLYLSFSFSLSYTRTLSLWDLRKRCFHWGTDSWDGSKAGSYLARHSSQFENHHLTEMCCGSKAGRYLRLMDSCITQLRLKDLLEPVTRVNNKKKKHLEGRVYGLRIWGLVCPVQGLGCKRGHG